MNNSFKDEEDRYYRELNNKLLPAEKKQCLACKGTGSQSSINASSVTFPCRVCGGSGLLVNPLAVKLQDVLKKATSGFLWRPLQKETDQRIRSVIHGSLQALKREGLIYSYTIGCLSEAQLIVEVSEYKHSSNTIKITLTFE
jgi:hypothetical protein